MRTMQSSGIINSSNSEVATVSWWVPLYKVAMALSLMLLRRIEPCVAFIQPPPSTSTTYYTINTRTLSLLPPLHGYKGGDDDKYNHDYYSRQSSFSTERRRKLIDRSNVYNIYSSTDSMMQLEEEEKELCYLDDIPGTNAGQTCFVSDSSSLSSDPTFLASLPFDTRIPPTTIDQALRYIPIVSMELSLLFLVHLDLHKLTLFAPL